MKIKENVESEIESVIHHLKNGENNEMAKNLSYFDFKGNLFKHLCESDFPEQLPGFSNKSISLFNSTLRHVYLRISNSSEFHSQDATYMLAFRDRLKKHTKTKYENGTLDTLKYDVLQSNLDLIDKVIQHVQPNN